MRPQEQYVLMINLLILKRVISVGRVTARLNGRYALFFLILFLPVTCLAQFGKLFSADKELSNSLIYDIHQDHHGVIWIATEDGLNRYDGAKFTIYKHDKKDSCSLQHNYVRLFFEDSKGHFLVGVFNGLQQYDYAADRFVKIPLLFEDGTSFGAHVVSLLERRNGDVLVGTSGQGIYKLSFDEERTVANKTNSLTPSNMIIFMYEDRQENLWVSTEDKGLYRLTKENQLKIFFKYDKVVLNNISSICEDGEGNVLVGSLTDGLFCHDRTTDKFYPVAYANDQHLPIKTLYPNSPDEIYIGTDGKGVKVYRVDKKEIADVVFSNVTGFDFSKSKVHSILRDKSDNLWLGVYQKGVLFIPAQTNKFDYIGYKSMKNNTIGSNYILSLLKDRAGILWVGTDSDGLYAVSADGKQHAHYAPGKEACSVPNSIMSMFEDSEGNFWIGSYLNGMARLDRKTGRCEYISNLFDENENPVYRIFAFAEDTTKTMWIGTMGAGLFSMDLRTGQLTNRNQMEGVGDEDNRLYNYWITCLHLSHDKLYIGTYDGLMCLDLKECSYRSVFKEAHLLAGMVIYCIYRDEEDILWAGTSEGLVQLKGDRPDLVFYTQEDGLPSNTICAIQGDDKGYLWVSTHYGISRFDRKSHFVNYYANDGLQGNEFSKNASFADESGKLYFGGISGVTGFYPKEIRGGEKQLDVKITGFYIYDKLIKKGDRSGSYAIIDRSVMDAETFQLSHEDNSFSIEFSAMEFRNPERIVFMYNINDGNRISLHPGVNRVSFSNLAPGTYVFKVKAVDYNFVSDEKEFTVIIAPPWYATLWAKILYGLIAVLIVWLMVMYVRQRYRSRQKMLEHQYIHEINEAKLQFFMNIAHEIRTPMSMIISPLKRLMDADVDPERQKGYHLINRNAERILHLINQLMDIRKIDKGVMVLKFQQVEMISFVRDLYTYFEYQAKAKQVEFNFHTTVDRYLLWIDPKNFDKIIINVLSNAFKYVSEKGVINMELNVVETTNETKTTPAYFEIAISDNGIGIKEEERERIFERFYQIRNNYNHSIMSTGIGLHLTRSLVELHHGKIGVENNEGGGSRFVIHIPIGNAHIATEEMEDNPELLQTSVRVSDLSADVFSEPQAKIRSKSKYRVMVVEDDDEIRNYLCKELSSTYHMAGYVNGKEAYEVLLKNIPDLIISDVMMPEVDGITLCRKVKQHVHMNHVPVILLTARSKEEDNLEGLSTGADAYIVKPFNLEILKKTIENLIHNRERLRNTFNGSQRQEDKVEKVHMQSADEKLLAKVMKVINEHLSDQALSVEMIADKVGISRVHLHRKLKELTNQTPRDFIRNIRLKQAADLLMSKNLSVSEVADATGFANMGYFSKVFKELYGVPPSTYLEEQKKKNTEI